MTDIAVVVVESARTEEACCPVCMDSVAEPKNGVGGRRRQRVEYKETDCWRLRCRHLYCVGCLTGWIQSKVNDRTVPIVCCNLECNREIRPSHVQAILTPSLFEKFSELVAIKSNEANSMYCPNKTCSQMFLKPSDLRPGQEKTVCVWCKMKICVVCEVEWHQGFTCEKYKQILAEGGDANEALLLNLKKNMNWKQCPKCKMLVERSSGCNFMRCTCGEHFCYECGSSYISRTPVANNPHGKASCKCSLYPQNNQVNNGILQHFAQHRPPPINPMNPAILNNHRFQFMPAADGLRNLNPDNHAAIPQLRYQMNPILDAELLNAHFPPILGRQQFNWNVGPPPAIPQFFPAPIRPHVAPRPKARAKKSSTAAPHPLPSTRMNLRPRKTPEQTAQPKARIKTQNLVAPVNPDQAREHRILFNSGVQLNPRPTAPQKQAARLVERKKQHHENTVVNLADDSPPRLPRAAKRKAISKASPKEVKTKM